MKNSDREKALFAAQCIVSAALIIIGIVIYALRTPFLQPAKTAFAHVVGDDIGITGISEAVNTFVDRSGLGRFFNED